VNSRQESDSVRFWYKADGSKDHGTYYLVDPVRGARSVLFDQNKMAAALSVAADTILDPNRFPRFRLVNKDQTLEIATHKNTFHCELASYKCVVADTLERAQHAATLVQVSYAQTPSVTTIDQGRADAYDAERIFGGLLPGRTARGDVDAGLAAAEVRVDAPFRFAANHHNPIEMHATIAAWDGDRLMQLVSNLMGNALAHGAPTAPAVAWLPVQLAMLGSGPPAAGQVGP